MTRRRCIFRQRDVTRVLRASVAAGVEVRRAEIDLEKGKIVLVYGSSTEQEVSEPAATLDSWRANRGAR
jgi:hypothetical protein